MYRIAASSAILFISLFIFSSCQESLYLHGNLFSKDQVVDAPVEKDSYLACLKKGATLRETGVPSRPDLAFSLVLEQAAGIYHVYEERFSDRRPFPDGRFHHAEVRQICAFNYDKITPEEALKGLDYPLLDPVCSLVNSVHGLSFRVFPVIAAVTPDPPPPASKFYEALYVQRNPCGLSEVIKLQDQISLPLGDYHEKRIHCLPDHFKDSLLIEVNGKGEITWFKGNPPPVDTSAQPKPGKGEQGEGNEGDDADTLQKEVFPFVCDKGNYFTVSLARDKDKAIKTITITRENDKKFVLFSRGFAITQKVVKTKDYTVSFKPSTRGAQYDSLLVLKRDSLTKKDADTVIRAPLRDKPNSYPVPVRPLKDSITLQLAPKTKEKNKDSIYIQLYRTPDYTYPYDPLFNEGSFERWLKMHYPTIGDLCAGELAFEIHLRDVNFQHCQLCKPADSASAAKDGSTGGEGGQTGKKDGDKSGDSSKPKKPAHLVVPGSVTIVGQEPFIMTPTTSKTPDTIGTYIPINLQVSGDYDSTASRVPFKLKFGNMLANHLMLYDTIITISQKDWDSAVQYNEGLLRVSLAVKYTNTKDSLTQTQEDYIVVADTVQPGKRKIRLMNYNPSSAFWMEVGSNFELLNGLQPRNIYAGILLFDKDAATINMFGRPWGVSFIGGAYESLTSSTAASSDSGIIYRNNVSYTYDPVHKGYPVYHDTGSVTVTSATKNIGLLFEPALRLTNIPADHNGVHLFVSAYTELLWQTVNTSNDYSKLGRDSSLITYLQDSTSLYKYRFKQNTSLNDDYRTSYLGLGMPFYLKRRQYTFFLNPVFGFTNQKFVPIRPYADPRKLAQTYQYPLDSVPSGYPIPYLQPRCSWNPFYLVQFRFNEEKYDITVTGEIRGLLLRNSSPLITLTLSKKFDLGNMINSILSPANPSK